MNPDIFLTGGIIAAIVAAWGQIKTLWSRLSSFVIVTISVQFDLVPAIQLYVQDNFRAIRLGPQTYTGAWFYVKPLSRVQLVAYRIIGKIGSIYLRGKAPIIVSRGAEGNKENSDTMPVVSSSMTVRFIRGTFIADEFISQAVSYYNKIRDDSGVARHRHYIKRVYGLSKKRIYASQKDEPTMEKSSSSAFDYRTSTPLIYTYDEIGTPQCQVGLSALALSEKAEESILEARRWKESEQWFKERSLPWKRGWLLYGLPGTGKTALTRAIAEELDIPVYIYDLASLANDELQMAWREMLSSVPCMALIEDIDAVFDKRQTAVGDLTFDCFLNCLDGIERSDGLFTIITTNNIEKLDAAIGIGNDNEISTRPGRVDRVIEMTKPDYRGRMKMAQRILPEYSSMWEQVIVDGNGDTGAQFQERCSAIALRLFWESKNA